MRQEYIEPNVKAQNEVAKRANEVQKELLAIFAEHLNQKVLKVDDGFLASIQKKLPKFENTSTMQIYRYNSIYSLVWIVKACAYTVNFCVYKEVSVYVGELSGGILIKLYEPANHKDNWTVEEVKDLIAKRDAAQRALDIANSNLDCFKD